MVRRWLFRFTRCGMAQQAALNPAVSMTDQGALVVALVYTATANLIAASVQEDDDAASARKANGDNAVSRSQPQTTKTLVTALKLVLFFGTVFVALLGLSGREARPVVPLIAFIVRDFKLRSILRGEKL